MEDLHEEEQKRILEEIEQDYFHLLDKLRLNLVDIGKEVGLHQYKRMTKLVEDDLVKDMERYYEESTVRAS